jgi:hypothetical protein
MWDGAAACIFLSVGSPSAVVGIGNLAKTQEMLTEHPGYECHQEPPGETGNTGNGSTPKTLVIEHGPVPVGPRAIGRARSSQRLCASASAASNGSTTRSSDTPEPHAYHLH